MQIETKTLITIICYKWQIKKNSINTSIIEVESNGKLREIGINNSTCYYFGGIEL